MGCLEKMSSRDGQRREATAAADDPPPDPRQDWRIMAFLTYPAVFADRAAGPFGQGAEDQKALRTSSRTSRSWEDGMGLTGGGGRWHADTPDGRRLHCRLREPRRRCRLLACHISVLSKPAGGKRPPRRPSASPCGRSRVCTRLRESAPVPPTAHPLVAVMSERTWPVQWAGQRAVVTLPQNIDSANACRTGRQVSVRCGRFRYRARLRSWTVACHPRGTIRGTSRRKSQRNECCRCDD